jgi:CDP-glucose 4,6-dehydratase
MPDCIRSLLAKRPIDVRNPAATRPWQHVLEPLSGYLWLGALMTGKVALPRVATRDAVTQAFNFGPWPEANCTVKSLVMELLLHWPGSWQHADTDPPVHEASSLNLAIDKAFHQLQWRPAYDFSRAVAATAHWYRQVADQGGSARDTTTADIADYVAAARAHSIVWAI